MLTGFVPGLLFHNITVGCFILVQITIMHPGLSHTGKVVAVKATAKLTLADQIKRLRIPANVGLVDGLAIGTERNCGTFTLYKIALGNLG